MRKTQILSMMILIFIGLSNGVKAQKTVKHNFNNGNLGPFVECTTKSPNYSRVVNKRLKTHWKESGYAGNRVTRGAEACADQFFTYKEGWYGMNLEIGTDYSKKKKGGIAQIFGFTPGFWSWEAQLQIDNGDLTIVHRPNGGTGNNTEEVVYANFPFGKKIPVVIHFILSNQQKGIFEIWVDGKIEYRKRNINFGFGEFDRNDIKIGDGNKDFGEESAGSLTVFKIGQYNFESDDYDNNETRTVYYDDVTWYNGSNGFNVVNPSNSGTPINSSIVHMKKRNASSYAIDGNAGGENGQNIYLWGSNSSNKNQQWNEVDRGNGYYSYQKAGTNYCMDGGNSGKNGQNVYLWTCADNNQNQHWKKVNVGSGNYRLEKRNASEYSIDGGNKGANGQNLYLWKSSNSNQNQHWTFGGANKSNDFTSDKSFKAYPIPFSNILNIQLDSPELETKVDIINITGQVVASKIITNNSNATMDLSNLSNGIYIAKATSAKKVQTLQLIKEE